MSERIARTSGEVGKKEKTGVYIQRSEEDMTEQRLSPRQPRRPNYKSYIQE